MRERGEPVKISRTGLERAVQTFKDTARKMDGPLPKVPMLSTPDHILESRGDCAVTFIEEGLLPLVRDVISPTTSDVLELAGDFINQFRELHPNDFDLDDPIDLIFITHAHLIPLSIVYTVRGRRSLNDQKISNLVNQASELLGQVMEETFPDIGADDEN